MEAAYMDNYENNKEIDMREVTATILVKWKKVLIIIILLFMALSSYQVIKTAKSNKSSDVASAAASLTDEEKQAVDNTFSLYQYYYTQYQNYSEKSKSFMNLLNPYQTPILNVNFTITTTISNPGNYYQNIYLSQSQINQLNELLNTDEQTSVSDLLSASVSEQSNDSSSINVFSGSDEKSFILNVQLLGVSQENTDAAANIISDAINAQTSLLDEKGYSASEAEISRSWEEGYSQTVGVYQSDFDLQYEKIKEQYNLLQDPSDLTDNQKTYYKALINDYLDVTAKSGRLLSPKKLILFLLASFMIVIILFYFYETIKSVLSKTVKTERDLVLAGCGSVFGVIVNSSPKKQLFSKQIIHLIAPDYHSEDEVLQLASNRILQQMKNQHAVSLFICNDSSNESSIKVVKHLCELLSQQIKVNVGAPGCNVADYTNFISSDSVLFIKSSGIDSDKMMIQEVDMANTNDKTIIGSILIKKAY